jgi:hypothetical protein
LFPSLQAFRRSSSWSIVEMSESSYSLFAMVVNLSHTGIKFADMVFNNGLGGLANSLWYV